MKKFFILMTMLVGLIPATMAYDGSEQRLTKEEFRSKQQAFIAQKAELTQEEAEKFFPLYFELQDEKKKLNDEAWKLMRQGRNKETTEATYEEILEKVSESRIASAELEQKYLKEFEKILSCKKIYQVQQAEMSFHRRWLKNMRDKDANRKPNKRPQAPRK